MARSAVAFTPVSWGASDGRLVAAQRVSAVDRIAHGGEHGDDARARLRDAISLARGARSGAYAPPRRPSADVARLGSEPVRRFRSARLSTRREHAGVGRDRKS